MSRTQQKRFDGQRWFQKQMDQRTRAALKEQEAAFVRDHGNDSDAQLLDVIRRRAGELGHSPRAVEVIGADLICRRFGSWAAALRAARLGYPIGATRLRSSRLYRQEYARQQALYRARRDAGKERKVP